MTLAEQSVYMDFARKENGCVIVVDTQTTQGAYGFHDTAISAGSSQGWEDPSVPAKIREMLSLYDYGDGSAKNKCRNFYKQGKFMEDYEDDFPWNGEFRRYFPTYHDLNIPQLRGYFTWRTRLRKGEHLPIATSLAYIYLYELLNGIGVSSVEESLWRMQEFETEFLETGICEPQIQYNLHRWMTELAIIHQLPRKKVLQYIEPYDIKFTTDLEILRNPANRTDHEIFMALRHFNERKLESSPVIRTDAVNGKHLFAEVWRLASAQHLHDGKDLFTTCFGSQTEFSWYPLANAVYLERRNLTDFTYELNGCLRYHYHNGSWEEETYKALYFKKEWIKELVHVTDRMLRRYLKKSPYLREKPEEAWAIPYVEAVIEADRQAKIEAARPKVHLNLETLVQIRKDAVVTRESLLTEEDLTEASIEPPTTELPAVEVVGVSIDDDKDDCNYNNDDNYNNDNDNGNATVKLDPLHREILLDLLDGGTADGFLRTHRLLPAVVADTINEAFFDEIGDSILECDGDHITLVENYVEEIRPLVEHPTFSKRAESPTYVNPG